MWLKSVVCSLEFCIDVLAICQRVVSDAYWKDVEKSFTNNRNTLAGNLTQCMFELASRLTRHCDTVLQVSDTIQQCKTPAVVVAHASSEAGV